MYEGIPEMLSSLRSKGYTLVVATGKPEKIAKKILHLFDLDRYFDFIGGAAEDESRHRKSDILKYVLDNIGASSEETVLVGDRKFDAEGARALGSDSIGVTWGHGSEEELEAAGFCEIVTTPEQLLNKIIN